MKWRLSESEAMIIESACLQAACLPLLRYHQPDSEILWHGDGVHMLFQFVLFNHNSLLEIRSFENLSTLLIKLF
jgi:hypothetical protein